MQTVAPILTFASDQQARDLTEVLPVGSDLTLLIVLVGVAVLFGRALLAVLAAAAALLVPAFALFRYLLVVVGMVILLGMGMADRGEQPAPEAPATPTVTVTPTKPATPKAPAPAQRDGSSLAARDK